LVVAALLTLPLVVNLATESILIQLPLNATITNTGFGAPRHRDFVTTISKIQSLRPAELQRDGRPELL
jgi:hypothetical protein